MGKNSLMPSMVKSLKIMDSLPFEMMIHKNEKQQPYNAIGYDYIYDGIIRTQIYKKHPFTLKCPQFKELSEACKKRVPKDLFDANGYYKNGHPKETICKLYLNAIGYMLYKFEVKDLNIKSLSAKTLKLIEKYSKYDIYDLLFDDETETEKEMTMNYIRYIIGGISKKISLYQASKHFKNLADCIQKLLPKNLFVKQSEDMFTIGKVNNVTLIDYYICKFALQNYFKIIGIF